MIILTAGVHLNCMTMSAAVLSRAAAAWNARMHKIAQSGFIFLWLLTILLLILALEIHLKGVDSDAAVVALLCCCLKNLRIPEYTHRSIWCVEAIDSAGCRSKRASRTECCAQGSSNIGVCSEMEWRVYSSDQQWRVRPDSDSSFPQSASWAWICPEATPKRNRDLHPWHCSRRKLCDWFILGWSGEIRFVRHASWILRRPSADCR